MMSVAVKLKPSVESRRKTEDTKKSHQKKKLAQSPNSILRSNASVDSLCSTDSSNNSISAMKLANLKWRMKQNGLKAAKGSVAVSNGVDISPQSLSQPVKRCDWITTYSGPLYAAFHDKEWGVPVHDDKKLFEFFVLSVALAELTWPTILNKRNIFRKLFKTFDPVAIAKFTEPKILTLKSNNSLSLSELKFRAIVENAKLILKIQEEFGSFNDYCWGFVNHKPIQNGYRYVRQIPVKTPKAEAMSKDLMRRGFRCVGPTVIYSFMQVAGIVNNHLVSCFRYKECSSYANSDFSHKIRESELLSNFEETCLSPD
ncbi:hypothetical protein GIB67_017413 [Kingdonia uniflora]|uniref:DNA-3-methyladenine glycosylase I n=1 Tax=Kingdonia uniflora TaxID=39325 RepID=A0A7J7M4D9_9MAGN|nr:hypothetical protein GIB67_017413 [Kingdonia uniflora]